MKVSLILTVLNEGESICGVLDSLAVQTRPPDEVVIADGGSRDNTVALLRDYAAAGRLPLRVIETPGANISQGRNAAIRFTTGEIIAVTDAGVRCAPDWLEKLTAPFARAETAPEKVSMVAGFFRPDVRTVFEIAMGATVLPEARDIRPETYLPSSRSVAYLKSAWEAVGGYPEWIDYCEDVIFDLKLRRQVGVFVFAPEAVVYFRPRGSLRAFARQYYLYARGDGKANLFWRQHAVRYFTYLVAAPLLVYAALTVSPWLWLLGMLAGLAYVRVPLRRLGPQLAALAWPDRFKAVLSVPVIRIVGDVAKMLGYPVGCGWRWRNRRLPRT
jgi:glycosyltransferase involved in cell wall biosynthesis